MNPCNIMDDAGAPQTKNKSSTTYSKYKCQWTSLCFSVIRKVGAHWTPIGLNRILLDPAGTCYRSPMHPTTALSSVIVSAFQPFSITPSIESSKQQRVQIKGKMTKMCNGYSSVSWFIDWSIGCKKHSSIRSSMSLVRLNLRTSG